MVELFGGQNPVVPTLWEQDKESDDDDDELKKCHNHNKVSLTICALVDIERFTFYFLYKTVNHHHHKSTIICRDLLLQLEFVFSISTRGLEICQPITQYSIIYRLIYNFKLDITCYIYVDVMIDGTHIEQRGYVIHQYQQSIKY